MLVQNLAIGDHVHYQAPVDGDFFLNGILKAIVKKGPNIIMLEIHPDGIKSAIDHVFPSDVREILD